MSLAGGIEEMKRRMEVLRGAIPAAPQNVRQAAGAAAQAGAIQRRERIAAAGGQLLTAAMVFLGELLPSPQAISGGTRLAVADNLTRQLASIWQNASIAMRAEGST